MQNAKWKPATPEMERYAPLMERIRKFCDANNIRASYGYDSYYFEIGGQAYRVSNHSPEQSNRCAYKGGVKVRDTYHPDERDEDTIYIQASKTKIIEIYTNLCAGRQLDGKGHVVKEVRYK